MTVQEGARGTVAYAIVDKLGATSELVSQVVSMRVFLHGEAPDSGAEVQVAVVDGSLVVIAAGHIVLADQDAHGFARIRVAPE